MEIRELEYFQMVSKLKSFTGAAQKLNVSQPSITIAIKKLEDELGISLLQRNKRTVALTNEGEIFFEKIDSILNDLNNAILEMNDLKKLKKEVIRLGMPPASGAHFLVEIFKKYKKNNINIDLIVNEMSSLGIVNLLEKGELDIGLIGLMNSSDLLETEKISDIEIFVCLPPDHPLKDLPVIPFQLLRDEKFILMKGGTNVRKIIQEEFEKHGFEPNIVFYSNLFQNISILVSNGMGTTLTTDPMARNNPNIVCCSLETPIYLEIGLAWKKNKFLTKGQRELINFMKSFKI